MKINQEKQSRSDKLSQKAEYKKYLEELEDPNYQGGSWALPENPTPLEQAKYDICRQVGSNISVGDVHYRNTSQRLAIAVEAASSFEKT